MDIKRSKWLKEINIKIMEGEIKKLELEISEIDARLKTLAEKKDQEKAAEIKSQKEKLLEMGKNQIEQLRVQIAADKTRIMCLK